MYDSVSGVAFGPVFERDDTPHDADDACEAFIAYCRAKVGDPRNMGHHAIMKMLGDWRAAGYPVEDEVPV